MKRKEFVQKGERNIGLCQVSFSWEEMLKTIKIVFEYSGQVIVILVIKATSKGGGKTNAYISCCYPG